MFRTFSKAAKILAVFSLLFSMSACDLVQEDDASSEGEVSIKSVDINCLITDAVGCSSSNNGATLRVGLVNDCDTFSSSSTVFAVAEATLDCDSVGCDLSTVITSANFSPTTVEAGTYDLYAFIDEDDDDLPDTLTEPIGCLEDVAIDGSTTSVTITDWE